MKLHYLSFPYASLIKHYALKTYGEVRVSTYSSTALVDLGKFFSSLFYTQSVGLLGRGISPSLGSYLHTEQHKHRINA
jgi:hypothetical protein